MYAWLASESANEGTNSKSIIDCKRRKTGHYVGNLFALSLYDHASRKVILIRVKICICKLIIIIFFLRVKRIFNMIIQNISSCNFFSIAY